MNAQTQEPVWSDELLVAPHEASDKRGRVRSMFNAIAPRYELVNSVCSGGRDAYWRRKAVTLSAANAKDTVLDVACGTGDFARAFLRAGVARVVGCDFAHRMLLLAAARGESDRHRPAIIENPPIAARWTGHPAAARDESDRHPRAIIETPPSPQARMGHPIRSGWIEADALQMPFGDESFTIVSCAFGVRNFADLDAGLCEFRRVLRPGGRAVILEFTRPSTDWVRRLYEVYANRIMPRAATFLSGDTSGAYRYLPRSVVSFVSAEEMCQKLRAAGFAGADAHALTFGVVTVYVAHRDGR